MLNSRRSLIRSIGLIPALLTVGLWLGSTAWTPTPSPALMAANLETPTAQPPVVLPTSTPGSTELPSSDPIIAAAGDIACDPSSRNYKDGQGTSNACRAMGTSDMLLERKQKGELTAVLALGDLQYEDGTASAFMASFDKTWGRLKEITYPVAGNHEYNTRDAVPYFEYFGANGGERAGGYYSFDLGQWHLLAINSNCSNVGVCGSGSVQETWLRADLAANQGKCTLAFWHHPLFSSGEHSNNESMRPIWQALYDYGAAIVLNGHDHNYERFAPQDPTGTSDPVNGIREFVVGTGGKSLRDRSTLQPNSELFSGESYGVLMLTLRPTSYEWQFISESDKSVIDSGTGGCNPRQP